MQAQVADVSASGFEPSLVLLRALADPTRLRLVWLLADGEQPVSRLAERLGAQVAAVYQHLERLRESGVVDSRRDGTRIFYRLASEHVSRLVEQVVVTAARLEAGPVEQSAPATRTPPLPAPALGPARRRVAEA